MANAAGAPAFVKGEHRWGGDTVAFHDPPPNALAHRVSGGVSAAALARSIPHSMMITFFIFDFHHPLHHERGAHETTQCVKGAWRVSYVYGPGCQAGTEKGGDLRHRPFRELLVLRPNGKAP